MTAIKQFVGVRNDVGGERFAPGDLAVANNLHLDNSGKLLTRGGYLKKINGAFHSLWAQEDICLFVSGTQLLRLNADLTTTAVVRSNLTAGLVMSYEAVNGRVYYNNGAQSGIYNNSENRSWGIVPPAYQPFAVADYGDMAAGRYQFALTYVRNDGQESGTGIADAIDLTTGALRFTNIAVSPDPTVVQKILYLTPCNGDVLYRAAVLDNATTTLLYNGGQVFTPLETQFKQDAPTGQLIGYAFGRMWVARGPFLFYSDPFGYELFDLRNYFPFAADITLFARVTDGIVIGTQKGIHFLQGREPDSMSVIDKTNYGAVPGTLTYAPASQVKGLQGDEIVPLWTSHTGVFVATTGGNIINLTQDRYTLAPFTLGAALFRTVDGINQYVAVLRP